uniref:Riboflavin transporter n=1 Tax=Parascaris equorum TaxID=6256 RepID=A0A914S1K4_PAREQ
MSVRVIVYIFVAFFGSSSWLSTNSIWMELPLLTDRLPEGWSLPSYLAAVVQVPIACIGPLIYSIVHKCTKLNIAVAPIIFVMLLFCCMCTALMAFFWHVTVFIFNQQRSLALIILLFDDRRRRNIKSHLYNDTGSSDECVLVNGTMIREKIAVRFGVREYNLVMLVWLLLATFSFVLLHWSKIASDDIKSTRTSTQLPIDEASPLNVNHLCYYIFCEFILLASDLS